MQYNMANRKTVFLRQDYQRTPSINGGRKGLSSMKTIKQIAKLQKFIDQEQQLRMVTEQKFLLLEQQEKKAEDEGNKKRWWHFLKMK